MMKTRKIGKSLARQQFLPLVRELGKSLRAVEITDKDKTVAVLLSFDEYKLLSARSFRPDYVKNTIVGSLEVVGDLEDGSKQIARDIWVSIERSASEL